MVRFSVSFFILLSFVSTALTIANAFFLKKEFYPSVVYLTKSNTSMAVIYFQAAILSYLIFSVLRWIFFGHLRVVEIEHAQERIWHAIMETCLAFTVFRDDFSPKFVMQFALLFFVKAFHWLTEDRVDHMERSPIITILFHARIMGILSILSGIDSYFISHAFFITLLRGASAQVVFGFEYAVLITMIAHITLKYIFHIHDLRSPQPWENKAVYMLYAELFANFLRFVLYIVFTVVMIKIHTFPLFAIRPFYLTIRALQKAINDVIQSRRAINAMNNLFPLATIQELTDGDNTCIICREEMTIESGAKKLPCNHIFHPNCLRSWFQRQQTCPTCRNDVLAARSSTVIPGANNEIGGNIPNNLINPGFFFGIQLPRQQVLFSNQQQNQQPLQQNQQNIQAPIGIPPLLNLPPAFMNFPNAPFNQPFGNPQFLYGPGGFMNPLMRFQPPPPPPPFQEQQQNLNANSNNSVNFNQQNNNNNGMQFESTFNSENLLNHEANNAQQNTSSSIPNSQSSQNQGINSTFVFPQPPTFSGFSDDEIFEMEGHTRNAVEARIQALRNISILLDAAILQFQQYISIVAIENSTLIPSQSETTSKTKENSILTANSSVKIQSDENLASTSKS